MIDLHCHLLPGIDDGASHIGESLALARMACDNGIKKSIVTPHITPGRFDNDVNTIRATFTQFQQALQENHIPLQVGMAAEVRISPEILRMVDQNLIPFLGSLDGYRIMLLELPYKHIPLGCDKMIRWLLDRKIRPMIAHPERNGDIVRHFEKIYPFIELGCLLQVTASSVAGFFGPKLQLRAQQLLEREWVTVIASDAHNQEHRPPDMESGRIAAAQIVGERAAWTMVHDTPALITQEQFSNS